MSASSIVLLIAFFALIVGAYRAETRFDTRIAERVVAWLFFSVLFALLPLAFNGGVLLVQGLQVNLTQLLSKGELLIVCAGIAAGATGEVLTSNINRRLTRILATSSCIIILALASFIFAYISSAASVPLNGAKIAELSITIFVLTLLTSTPCILMSVSSGDNYG